MIFGKSRCKVSICLLQNLWKPLLFPFFMLHNLWVFLALEKLLPCGLDLFSCSVGRVLFCPNSFPLKINNLFLFLFKHCVSSLVRKLLYSVYAIFFSFQIHLNCGRPWWFLKWLWLILIGSGQFDVEKRSLSLMFCERERGGVGGRRGETYIQLTKQQAKAQAPLLTA